MRAGLAPDDKMTGGGLAGADLAGGGRVAWTGRSNGDMRAASAGVEKRRAAVVDRPWSLVRQVHGTDVIVVERPGDSGSGVGDALVTAHPGAAIAVLTADCAPVALASPEGVFGVAHAGWRGLAGGVLEAAVAAMRRLGAGRIEAVLGPCIHPECYAFGAEDLDRVADRLGAAVRATDRDGHPALDIPAGVAAVLERAGAELVGDAGVCTSCDEGYWSWRARADAERQATVVWKSGP